MEQVLGGANKVIVDKSAGGSGVVPYLPLPAVQAVTPSKPTSAAPAPTDATQATPTATPAAGN